MITPIENYFTSKETNSSKSKTKFLDLFEYGHFGIYFI